jgi:DNA polymerase elongation subunit (family B)
MYENDLIFGKNKLENIVSVEPDEDQLIVFQEINGKVEKQFIPNKYWILTNQLISSKQVELSGDQHYKYMCLFDSIEEQRKVRSLIRKKNIDKWDVWDLKEASLLYHGMTYYKGLNPKDISILFFDIETTGLVHDKNSRVLLISNTFRKNGKIVKKLFAYDDYKSDAEMLKDWCKWVRDMDPSIMCGHNIYGFDFPYLQHCFNLNNINMNLGRDNSSLKFNDYTSKKRKDGSQDIEYYNCFIWGREIVDSMFLAITYDVGRKYESYGLKAIIAHEGLEKKDRTFYDAGEIRNRYKDPVEWKKIKAYATDDADDAMSLFDLMIPAYFYFTQSVSKTFQQMINSATGGQLNNIMVRSYLQHGHSIAKADEANHFLGAISFGVPGIYSNAFKQDISSLYPSIIRQYSIYNKQKDPEANFLKMVEYFTLERLKNKKLSKDAHSNYYKDLEQSQKVGINSAYGFLGSQGLNYNYPFGGAEVTRYGREILEKAVIFSTGKNVNYWKEKINE